jgi:hypothetical protein
VQALRILTRRRSTVVVVAALTPFLVAALLSLFRDSITTATQVLVLVTVVVAFSASGIRAAGLAAVLSSAAFFDFFLTAPYHSFAVKSKDDLEAVALLLVIGGIVTELALWGQRQQSKASRTSGFLDGLATTAQAARAGRESPQQLVDQVAARISETLDLDSCTFRAGRPPPGLPELHRDGHVSRSGADLDVRLGGLPVDTELVLPVTSDGEPVGCFLLVAASHTARPSIDQRRIAVLLADQAVDAARALQGTG